MANFDQPRRGSAAANALQSLYNIGGNTTISEWMRTIRWRQSRMQFCRSVVDSLERAWLIKVVGEQCESLPAARQYLGIPATTPAPVPAEPVAPRTAISFRPMQRSRSPMVIRPGAFDFREHPSRIGDDLVAYKGPGGFSGAALENDLDSCRTGRA
ncbi:MAG: hypothetical protein K2X55_13460 [Burkholderiaceae bacterium]|nr:hypothetical protein [Burkholderiaceae bacterium]